MQLPRHTPLQSRLLASTITASLFVVLWTCFQTLQFAYAAEIAIPPELLPHNELKYSIPQASPDSIDVRGETKGVAEHDGLYAPDFTYFDRYLIGRQQEQVRNLTNDKILYTEIVQKATLFFTFEKTQTSGKGTRSVPLELLQDRSTENTSERDVLGEVAGEENIEGESLEGGLRKRQSGRAVWVSANTCSQPTPSNNNGTDSPSQLILHVSTSEQKPTNSSKDTTHIPFVGGFANFTTNTTSDLYMGVSASELPDKWTGGWSFEIAASVNGYYHSYNDTEYMHMVDTDSDSTLFVSFPLQNSNKTEDVLKWNNTMPFTFHAYPTGNWSGMIGLERSFCKLRDVTDGVLVKPDLTQLFDDKRLPKAQFNVQGLKTNQTYTGFLAVTGGTTDMDLYNGGTVRGGGQVFKQFNWTTKADDTCQVILGLKFCEDTAYAVPSSSFYKEKDSELIALYDTLAASYYQNFSNSLDQVACDTTSSAQYSLARTCENCREDYKKWLCSVVIPRCEDYSATDPWLHERNINTPFANGSLPYTSNATDVEKKKQRFAYNQSRVKMIDEVIKPGPYKELLPCDYLCYDIVRSCPAQLGFSCPNSPAMDLTYGHPDLKSRNLTCNFPGAVVKLNQVKAAAARVGGTCWGVVAAMAVVVVACL